MSHGACEPFINPEELKAAFGERIYSTAPSAAEKELSEVCSVLYEAGHTEAGTVGANTADIVRSIVRSAQAAAEKAARELTILQEKYAYVLEKGVRIERERDAMAPSHVGEQSGETPRLDALLREIKPHEGDPLWKDTSRLIDFARTLAIEHRNMRRVLWGLTQSSTTRLRMQEINDVADNARRALVEQASEIAELRALTRSATRESEVYCHECSKAGGAERPIYHLPPVCPTERGS